MCNYGDPPVGQVIDEMRQREQLLRQASLDDPNGVVYMDQLWEQVEPEHEPLRVVYRVGRQVFSDVRSDVYWRHGPHPWRHDMSSEVHEIYFVLPIEVVRRVQESHMRQIGAELFGLNLTQLGVLPQAFGDWPATLKKGTSDGLTREVISDWPTLKEVIRLAAESPKEYRPTIKLYSGHRVRARVMDDRIEVCIDDVVPLIVDRWNSELRKRLGVRDR